MKETGEIFSTLFLLEFKNYSAISGFLSTCSLSTNRELLNMISQYSLMGKFFILCATF